MSTMLEKWWYQSSNRHHCWASRTDFQDGKLKDGFKKQMVPWPDLHPITLTEVTKRLWKGHQAWKLSFFQINQITRLPKTIETLSFPIISLFLLLFKVLPEEKFADLSELHHAWLSLFIWLQEDQMNNGKIQSDSQWFLLISMYFVGLCPTTGLV